MRDTMPLNTREQHEGYSKYVVAILLEREYTVPLRENKRCRWTVFFYLYHGVRLSPLGTAANVWRIVPAPDDR
jgi:hypothetical protein